MVDIDGFTDSAQDITEGFMADSVKGVSAVFAGLFLISGGLHIWQSTKYHCWTYTWSLPFACLLMVAAFIIREYMTEHHSSGQTGAVQGLFYAATPTYTLILYSFLYRLLLVPPKLVRIRSSYYFSVTTMFNTAVITTLSQGASTYWNSDVKPGQVKAGLALIKASLFLQLAPNIAYLAIMALLTYRQKSRYMPSEYRHDRKTTIVTYTLYVLMGLIVVRNIFRTIQIFEPPTSGWWTSEVYFWIFEACVMLAFSVVFHVMHPAKYLDKEASDLNDSRCRGKRRGSDSDVDGMRLEYGTMGRRGREVSS